MPIQTVALGTLAVLTGTDLSAEAIATPQPTPLPATSEVTPGIPAVTPAVIEAIAPPATETAPIFAPIQTPTPESLAPTNPGETTPLPESLAPTNPGETTPLPESLAPKNTLETTPQVIPTPLPESLAPKNTLETTPQATPTPLPQIQVPARIAPDPPAATTPSAAIPQAPESDVSTRLPPWLAAPVSNSSGLTDIAGHWAQPFIEALVSQNMMQGFPDRTFRPNAPINRAEFAVVIEQAFHNHPALVRWRGSNQNGARLPDVGANYWARPEIAAVTAMGFMQTYPDGGFRPEQPVSRIELLMALVKGLELPFPEVNVPVLEFYFQDADKVPESARESILAAIASRLVVPNPNVRNLNPNQAVTRAEVSLLLYRALTRIREMPAIAPEQLVTSRPTATNTPDVPLASSSHKYIWPTKGVLTSRYGPRWGRIHRGIDIGAPIGTPVVASAAGEVVTAGWNSGGYGNLVEIRHDDGSLTRYGHNHRLLVRAGQRVEQGQLIAEVGSTGYSTGPHSHFEIHPPGGGAVDPLPLLAPKP